MSPWDEDTLVDLRDNHKTQFLMTQFDALMKHYEDAVAMVESDPSLRELAE